MPTIKRLYDDDPDTGRPRVMTYQVYTVEEVLAAQRQRQQTDADRVPEPPRPTRETWA